MFCINCGATVDEDSVFCTNCGKRIKADPVVTVAEQEAQAMAEPVVPVNAPVQSEIPAVSEQPSAEIPAPSYTSAYEQPPAAPFIPENQQPEKLYFGKGALAFCLVIIGLLAISTGVFAGLYFSLL